MTLYVHFVRHGEVASHQGDVPITEDGAKFARKIGALFGEKIMNSEKVTFLYASTNRTRQTAEMMRKGILDKLQERELEEVDLSEPTVEDAIRNPDIYLGGLRVEMVSTPEALAEQTKSVGLNVNHVKTVPFWPQFWESPDRIGYWLGFDDPPGENTLTVARRLMKFAESLEALPGDETRRFICVTHSPVLRAFLNTYLLEKDLGEPEYCETIDMTYESDGSCTIRYRDFIKTINNFQTI
ncbi:histidine phosphatase family protein [Bacillus sp. JJ1521]|uniref:histidine phosphatase family protein n=1 Tax=Bacillus sp. JJ1521 TaxID=3122957 RepID=UPI002FFEAD1C